MNSQHLNPQQQLNVLNSIHSDLGKLRIEGDQAQMLINIRDSIKAVAQAVNHQLQAAMERLKEMQKIAAQAPVDPNTNGDSPSDNKENQPNAEAPPVQ